MIYTTKKIMRDVRVAIDENSTCEQLIADEDIDTLSLDDIIRPKIEEAARRVISEAPVHLLDGGVPFGDAIFWRDMGSGWALLPDNFMRLIIFKMSDWERPVYEPITAADPKYQMQFSRHKGLRGNPQKPIVAIVSRAEGLALELFSCRDNNATVEQALYLPFPKIDRHDGIEIPKRCYNSVVYQAASLALITVGQNNLATLMSDLSKQLLI